MNLIPLPAFNDNYIWMLHDGRDAIVVDPGEAAPVIICGFVFGLRQGVLVAILSGLSAWYFFISPGRFDFSMGTLLAMSLYLFVVTTELGLIHLMMRAYRAEAAARSETERLAEQQETMAQELDHRLKNIFATINAIISLSLKNASSADELAARLRDRLTALGRSNLLLRGLRKGDDTAFHQMSRQWGRAENFSTKNFRPRLALRSGAPRFGAQGGFGEGGVFGPGVARVLAAHVLAHIGIGGRPEARQVHRHLNRALAGRQERDPQRKPRLAYGGMGGHAKHLLQPNFDAGAGVVIVDGDAAIQGRGEMGGDEAVKGGLLVPGEEGFQRLGQVQ